MYQQPQHLLTYAASGNRQQGTRSLQLLLLLLGLLGLHSSGSGATHREADTLSRADERPSSSSLDGRNRTPFKIYAYNLSAFRISPHLKGGQDMPDNYKLEDIFPRLLMDSPYYTERAEEADLFYSWVWFYHHVPQPTPDAVVSALRRAGPWWDRKGGR